jgi:hypothetical protein
VQYLEIVRALADNDVRYVVIGGVAVILHGVPRTTYDLDLIVDLAPDNVARLIEALERLGYRPRAPVPARQLGDPAMRAMWVEEKGMKAFSFWRPEGGEVDILIDAPLDYSEVASDQEPVEVEGRTLFIASVDALVRLKSVADREQDRADIEALERVRALAKDDDR